MKRVLLVLFAFIMLTGFSFANTPEDLNGVSGKIFNVDKKAKCFELLKETVFDPKTNEGKSRHKIYWADKTKFTKIETKKDFTGITGPVVTDFYGFRKIHAKALAAGKPFSAKNAMVMTDARKAYGMSKDGNHFTAWFTPQNTESPRSGTVKLNGKQVEASLVNPPAARVFVRSTTTADEITVGFWETTIHGKYVNGKFVLDNLEIRPLVDPRTVDDPNLPRVLVIGDSISMNYHAAAKSALEGKANYYRCRGNGGPSDRGIASAELWLGDYTKKGLHWDIIQFNHGLHDLKQPYDRKNKTWGPHQVSIEDYKMNLEKEIQILKKSGAKLIWCTTTPVPQSSTGKYARRKGESAVYNKAAMEVISEYPEISVNDLHKFITESKEFDNWRKGTDVHFWSKDLQTLVGNAIAKAIKKAIENK